MSIPSTPSTPSTNPETNIHLPPPLPLGESPWFEIEDAESDDDECDDDTADDEVFEPEVYYDPVIGDYCQEVIYW